jgi:acetyl-CoA carboxylase carboxyltransferase component
MYEEHGGCPAGGVVVMIGYIRNRQCIVVANDATVKAGAWFPITGKKICAPRKSPWKTGSRLSIWWIPPVFICPCRMRFFPTRSTSDVFSGIMHACLLLVSLKSLLWGVCGSGLSAYHVGRGADCGKTGSVFLAGPYLVKAAIGEDSDREALGGASTHSEISGVTDYKMPDDKTCSGYHPRPDR